MLSSIVASKTAKMLGTCVCPVVGAAGVTMAVPKVRNAVHKATAPHEYALPKTRVRPQGIAAAPCAEPALLPLGAPAQIALNDIPQINPTINPSPAPFSTPIPTTSFTPQAPNDSPPTQVAAVPEPAVWLQLIFGFTLVGGAIRAATRGLGGQDEVQAVTVAVTQTPRG